MITVEQHIRKYAVITLAVIINLFSVEQLNYCSLVSFPKFAILGQLRNSLPPSLLMTRLN